MLFEVFYPIFISFKRDQFPITGTCMYMKIMRVDGGVGLMGWWSARLWLGVRVWECVWACGVGAVGKVLAVQQSVWCIRCTHMR